MIKVDTLPLPIVLLLLGFRVGRITTTQNHRGNSISESLSDVVQTGQTPTIFDSVMEKPSDGEVLVTIGFEYEARHPKEVSQVRNRSSFSQLGGMNHHGVIDSLNESIGQNRWPLLHQAPLLSMRKQYLQLPTLLREASF
jgi:hypothetical protein